MSEGPGLGRELDYVLLLFALFVVPRVLQRYRSSTGIPARFRRRSRTSDRPQGAVA